MLALHEIFWFAMVALVLAFTPGPNMAYCLSRALCQGRLAGLVSLAGVLAAYGVLVLATALGLTALLLTSPVVFEAIRFAGAGYLLWLAWLVARPASSAALQLRAMKPAPMFTLFCMGFLINLLNPKAVLFYVALFPHFLRPERGALVTQSLQLGAVQIAASGVVMGLMVCAVSLLQRLWSGQRVLWRDAPRYLMGGVFAALALRLVTMQIV